MRVVRVSTKYLVRLLKLWIIWFWFLALDGLGLIVDTFIPGFSPPRWLYWVIPAVGFLVANVKLFAEMESEMQTLQNRITGILDAKPKLMPFFRLGKEEGKKLSDYIVLPTRSTEHIQTEELAAHSTYPNGAVAPDATKVDLIEKGFVPLYFVVNNTGKTAARNARLYLHFPKECILVCGLPDWSPATGYGDLDKAIGPVPEESEESNQVFYHIFDEIISGIYYVLYGPLYVLFPSAAFRKERDVVTVHWTICADGTDPLRGELTILLSGEDEWEKLLFDATRKLHLEVGRGELSHEEGRAA